MEKPAANKTIPIAEGALPKGHDWADSNSVADWGPSLYDVPKRSNNGRLTRRTMFVTRVVAGMRQNGDEDLLRFPEARSILALRQDPKGAGAEIALVR